MADSGSGVCSNGDAWVSSDGDAWVSSDGDASNMCIITFYGAGCEF